MSKLKLLIAEDEKAAQLIYKKAFQENRFNNIFDITIVNDGEEALKTFQGIKPDILVLDIMMPIMSGFNVLKKIREKKSNSSSVVIMVTKLSDKSDIADCAKLGIDGYIIKPIKAGNIGDKILAYYKKRFPEKKV